MLRPVNHYLPTLLLVAVLPAGSLIAQEPAPPAELIDRIVAVVGDSVVLQTDIDEQIMQFAAMGQPIPDDPAALAEMRRELLEMRIDELLLLQAADRDSVIVSETEIESEIDREMNRRRQMFGGEQGFQQALQQAGLTVPEYRELLRTDFRRNLTIQYYIGSLRRDRRPPAVSEAEIRAHYERNRDQLGQRPATVSFRQAVIAPRPGEAARSEARSRIEDILRQVRDGADFEQLARRHSEDPGSNQRGGDLGWFRRGQMVNEFDDAVFALRPGEISGVVETSFGYHIIKLERSRGAERHARHILIRPDISEADQTTTRELAEAVAERARAGESLRALHERYGDPIEQHTIESFPRDGLPEPYARAMSAAEVNDLLGPIQIEGEDGAVKWAVVRITRMQEAGAYTLEDVRHQVRDQLAGQKLLDEVLKDLRDRAYIDIRL